MQLNLTVQNANSIVCQVVPTPTQTINIDRGVTGNGIASIVPVTIATFQYLQITYTNGTVVDVGPLTSTAYTATSPIVITGNTISLSTVQPQQGGTGAAGTLTGYVYGNATGAMTASTTIPNTAITGLGTMSTQNANNVAITGGTIQGVALTIDSIQSTPIGSTTPSTGAFTTLSASSTVSGTGFSTYLASPPAIGGTAANTAKFTTLAVTGLTGYTYANGSGNLTASTTIPNAGLANSSLTVNGVSIALGASGTVTAAAGTLTGTTLNSTVTGSSLTSVGTITTGVWNATPITNSFLANSSITVNGTSIALGGSGTITAATTSTLTIGSGLSGGSFNGSAPVTIANTGVLTFSGGTTGLTPNTATNGAITLAGTLAVANGGTGVTSSSGANSVVLRDANGNVTTNCLFEGYTSQAAGTTITLTASSVQNWAITGSGGQTIQLPNATTLPAGATFTFNNNQSSGTIVVQNNSATTIATVQSGSYITVVLLNNSSAAGSWDYHNSPPSNASWSTNTLNWAGSYTNGTWNGNAVGAIYGGTGQTAVTTGDLLYGSASNTWSRLGVGSTGQILRVAGGVPTWGVDYTGTVTSVAATVPSFLSISGSPITTSGTLAIGYSGTALPTANGGTGLTSFTANQIFYASSTSAFAQSANLTFDGTNLGLSGGTANGVAYLNGSKVLTTSTNFYFDGTNLALAAGNAPTQALNLYRSGSTAVYMAAGNSNTGINGTYFGVDTSGNAVINQTQALATIFSINGSEQMRLTSTGLGIGTSSPAAKLQLTSTGASASLYITNTTATTGKTWKLNSYDDGNLYVGVPSVIDVAFYTPGGNYVVKYGNNIVIPDSAGSYGSGNGSYIYNSGQTLNIAMRNSSDGVIAFTTGASERARIDSSGNLLLNATTNPSSAKFYANVSYTTGTTTVASFGAASSYRSSLVNIGGATGYYGNGLILACDLGSTQGANRIVSRYGSTPPILAFEYSTNSQSYGSDPATLTYAEGMRMDNSGNLLVGQTSKSQTTVGAYLASDGSTSSCMSASTSGTTTWNTYSTGAGAFRFYVDMGGTIHATSIVITAISDQRLKENVRDIDTGLDAIMALKPRRFDWKEGKGQDKKNAAGFIAQEFETVFPECVSTSKAGDDGIEYKNINHETLIPTLVKAIQELKAEFDAYKASHP